MSTAPMQVELTPAAGKALAGYLARELRRKPLAVTLATPPTAPVPEQSPALDAAPRATYRRVARDSEDVPECAWLDATGRLRWLPMDGEAPPDSWLPLYVCVNDR